MIEITNSTRALSNKSMTNLGTKNRRLVVWSQEGVKITSDQFSAKPQKIQPCIIQGTGADLCGSSPLTQQKQGQKQLSLLATVTKPWVVIFLNININNFCSSQHRCQTACSARSAVHIVTFTMFKDQGLSSTRRTAHKIPAWKETRTNMQVWKRTAVEVFNFSVFLYCWVNSDPDLLDWSTGSTKISTKINDGPEVARSVGLRSGGLFGSSPGEDKTSW